MNDDDARQARLAAIRAAWAPQNVVFEYSTSGRTVGDDVRWLLAEMETATALAERAEALDDLADDLLSHPTPVTTDGRCWFCTGGLGIGPNGHRDTCAWRRMRAALAEQGDG